MKTHCKNHAQTRSGTDLNPSTIPSSYLASCRRKDEPIRIKVLTVVCFVCHACIANKMCKKSRRMARAIHTAAQQDWPSDQILNLIMVQTTWGFLWTAGCSESMSSSRIGDLHNWQAKHNKRAVQIYLSQCQRRNSWARALQLQKKLLSESA